MVMVEYLIWANQMAWLGHVTGTNSATTTYQPRPANRDRSVSLAFELIKKRALMPQYASKEEIWKLLIRKLIF